MHDDNWNFLKAFPYIVKITINPLHMNSNSIYTRLRSSNKTYNVAYSYMHEILAKESGAFKFNILFCHYCEIWEVLNLHNLNPLN